MDQRKLEHFLAVMEHGQFNLAAAANGVSQQAISKAIAKLEGELDVKLFERNALGAIPTIYAKALEGRAHSILAETRLATAELNALSGAVLGTLNIGVGLAAARHIVPRAIHAFRAQKPGIGISATVEAAPTLYGRLLRGELDLVISPLPEGTSIDPHIQTTLLFTDTDKPMVGAKHPLAALKRVTLADLATHTWIAPRHNAAIWFEICHAFAAIRLAPPADVIRTDSMPLAMGLLEHENCIVMLGTETMALEIAEGRIKVLEVPGLAMPRRTHMATRRATKLSPTAKAFVPLIQEMCRARQSRGA